MMNQQTAYYPTGTTSTVTIVSEATPNYGPGGYTYSTFNSRSVHVGPNSFGPGYMVSPQMYRRGCALYLLIVGISLCVFGIIPIIAGAVILSTVDFGGAGGAIPLAFGCIAFCVGVSLLIVSCCMAKKAQQEQSTTGNLNTVSGQTTFPSGQGFNGQFSQPAAFGQNPPMYTGLNPQYPPAYQPPSDQYAQQNQGFVADQNPPQYQGSGATPYQPSAEHIDKPFQQ